MVSFEKGRLDFFLPFLFLSPILLVALQVGELRISDWEDLLWASKNSFLQAFLSSVFNILIGFFLALGLQSFSGLKRKFFDSLLLLPSLLPSIFSLVLVLSVITPFPMGIAGIVIVHVVTGTGLASVLIAQLLQQRSGIFWEVSEIFGLATVRRWTLILGSLRRELAVLGVTLFVSHFLSFSVPLVVGGGSGTTLEVLIFENVRISQDYAGALGIGLIQILSLGVLYALVQSRLKVQQVSSERVTSLTVGWGFRLAVIIWSTGYFLGLLISGLVGLKQSLNEPEIWRMVLSLVGPSLTLAIVVALMVWQGLVLSLFVLTSRGIQCVNLLTPPSYTLIGLALATLPFARHQFEYCVGFAFICIFSLLRLGWTERIESLRSQIEIAEVFGLSRRQRVRKVLLPQMRPLLAQLVALSSVWAIGDFAFARIYMYRDETLAMFLQTLLGSYKIHLAQGFALVLAVLGILLYLFVWKVTDVLSQKS